jgi:hypothetical protein
MVMRGALRLTLKLALIFAMVLTLGTTLSPECAHVYMGSLKW